MMKPQLDILHMHEPIFHAQKPTGFRHSSFLLLLQRSRSEETADLFSQGFSFVLKELNEASSFNLLQHTQVKTQGWDGWGESKVSAEEMSSSNDQTDEEHLKPLI